MPSNYSRTAKDQRTHIPTHIEQAMNTHMQQSMPSHLKKYVGSGHGYIPQHAERQIAAAMQKTMPSHLKQYAGAYMQQNIIQPNSARPAVMPQSPRTMPHPPMPDKLRRGHSMPYGEQHTVELNTLPNDQSLFQAEQPPAQNGQPPDAPYHPSYDFFMNSNQPPKRSLLPAGASTAMRALIVGGIIFVLLIGFVIVKNILGGSTSLDSFVTIAQDQQELIHLSGSASAQEDLSSDNKNFVSTAELSLRSSQSDLIQYLTQNHQKLTAKSLSLRVSSTIDQQLALADSAGTYNRTLQEVMESKLNTYINDLEQTFSNTKGQKGRALLNDEYVQAKLLLKQLSASSTSN